MPLTTQVWRQSHFEKVNSRFPANIYLFKVNSRNTGKRCEICSELTLKGLSLTRNRREVHMFYLAREVGKIWRCSC